MRGKVIHIHVHDAPPIKFGTMFLSPEGHSFYVQQVQGNEVLLKRTGSLATMRVPLRELKGGNWTRTSDQPANTRWPYWSEEPSREAAEKVFRAVHAKHKVMQPGEGGKWYVGHDDPEYEKWARQMGEQAKSVTGPHRGPGLFAPMSSHGDPRTAQYLARKAATNYYRAYPQFREDKRRKH